MVYLFEEKKCGLIIDLGYVYLLIKMLNGKEDIFGFIDVLGY